MVTVMKRRGLPWWPFRKPTPAAVSEVSGLRSKRLTAATSQARWEPRPEEWELLSDLEHELLKRDSAVIVLLVGDHPSPLGQVLQEAFRHLTIHTVDIRVAPDVLHATLAARGPYDMIIDDSRRAKLRKRVFRNTWYHLRPGGLYVVRDIRPNGWPDGKRPVEPALWPVLLKMISRRGQERPKDLDRRASEEWFRSEALGWTKFGTSHLIMENLTEAYAKMGESQMNEVIATRADSRAELIQQLSPSTFRSRAHLDPPELLGDDGRFKINFSSPELSVRRYRDAIVAPPQVALQGNLVLPESYRHNQRSRLQNRGMQDLSHYFAKLEQPGSIRRLPGRYFHLDAEWREHFGHLLTEQISRLWAWSELKQRWPDLKAVLSLQKGRTSPRTWELEIFSAAGLSAEDLVIIDGPTQVDELIGATPMLSMPEYIDPRIEALWNRIGDSLVEHANGSRNLKTDPATEDPPAGEPIFITRPLESKIRRCHNQAEVEQYFASRGFRVVHPERYPVGEQVRIFRGAPIVAGFAGSAMFTLMFRRDPVQVILLRPASYTSVNEYLISAVRGHTLNIIDSIPDHEHPPGKWTWDAFYSGFTFNFDREGRQLDDTLGKLQAG